MDTVAYQKYLQNKAVTEESICKRCGICCGANNDPCVNLARDKNGLYRCLVYENRLGPQRTVSGKIFTCVLIKDNIRAGFSHVDCAYLKAD